MKDYYYVTKNKSTSVLNNKYPISSELAQKSKMLISESQADMKQKKRFGPNRIGGNNFRKNRGLFRGRPGANRGGKVGKEKKYILDSNFNLENSPFKSINPKNVGKIQDDNSLFQVRSFKSLNRQPQNHANNRSNFLPAIKGPRRRAKRKPALDAGLGEVRSNFERNPYHPDEGYEYRLNNSSFIKAEQIGGGAGEVSDMTLDYLKQFKKGFRGVNKKKDRFRMISLNKRRKMGYRGVGGGSGVGDLLVKGRDVGNKGDEKKRKGKVRAGRWRKKGKLEKGLALARSAKFEGNVGLNVNGVSPEHSKNKLQISNFLVRKNI